MLLGKMAHKECPNCGGTDFDEGSLGLYNSISYVVYNSEKHKFKTLGNSVNVRVCLKCGHLDIFVKPKALKDEKANGKAKSG
jgi:Zn ribbon nucleic-acid-binding protein